MKVRKTVKYESEFNIYTVYIHYSYAVLIRTFAISNKFRFFLALISCSLIRTFIFFEHISRSNMNDFKLDERKVRIIYKLVNTFKVFSKDGNKEIQLFQTS